jgi:hypothetical protein
MRPHYEISTNPFRSHSGTVASRAAPLAARSRAAPEGCLPGVWHSHLQRRKQIASCEEHSRPPLTPAAILTGSIGPATIPIITASDPATAKRREGNAGPAATTTDDTPRRRLHAGKPLRIHENKHKALIAPANL